ncbi:MAG: ankyrin repeat domain-containing protein [Verrucomicrobiota bacterium]
MDPNYDPDAAPSLHQALMERDFARAREFLSSGESLDDIIEDDGYTFLHVAAAEGDMEMVQFFLNHGCPKSLENFNEINQTPLIAAASNGQLTVIKLLLANGAKVNANDEERIGNTAIREAVYGGHASVVEELLNQGADPTIPGWMAMSAVDQAFYTIEGGMNSTVAQTIQSLLMQFPSNIKDRYLNENA